VFPAAGSCRRRGTHSSRPSRPNAHRGRGLFCLVLFCPQPSFVASPTVVFYHATPYVLFHAYRPLSRAHRLLDALDPALRAGAWTGCPGLHNTRRNLRACVGFCGGVIILHVARSFVRCFLPEMDECAFGCLTYFHACGPRWPKTDREFGIVEISRAHFPRSEATLPPASAPISSFRDVAETPRGHRSALGFHAAVARETFSAVWTICGAVPHALLCPPPHRVRPDSCRDVIHDLAGAAKPHRIKLFGERLDKPSRHIRRPRPAISRGSRASMTLFNGVLEPFPRAMMPVIQADADRIGRTPRMWSSP